MMNQRIIVSGALLAVCMGLGLSTFSQETFIPFKTDTEVPKNVNDLWKDYDPRAEDLDVKVIKEWKNDGIVTRYVTFKVGTFKGADSRIAAYYCFPENGKKNPAFVWSHGGGQRADRSRGFYFAKQGYATVDINWGGRTMEEGIEENTDWVNVDPSQGPKFYTNSLRKSFKSDFETDAHTIDPVFSPRNSSWFVLAVAAKRAITFLEQQPEVDAERIGFAGFSMGGQITSMASIDPRLKAVAPFVGGTGFRHVDFQGGLTGTSQKYENTALYADTIDAGAYWPLVKCPVLFISSSNDFNAAFDRIYRAMALLTHKAWRVSTNIHENHHPGPEQWVLLLKWFNLHLKRVPQYIPQTPASALEVNGQTATFTVTPENRRNQLLETEIYYSYDPNPMTRFWVRADAEQNGKSLVAAFPVYAKLPVYVYALCRYDLGREEETLFGKTSTLTVNSLLHSRVPENIDLAEVEKLHDPAAPIDDFKNGFRDWSVREEGRSITTYKFQSPFIDSANDRKLSIALDPKGSKLRLQLQAESRFHGKGPNLSGFFCNRAVEGNGVQNVVIARDEFKTGKDGEQTLEWSKLTRFTLSLMDMESEQKVDLLSEEGREILKSIRFVD